MQNQNEIPDYLQEIYDLLRCAFPDGVSDENYWPLLAILHPHMSFRTLARVLAALTDKSYIEVFNDASGFGLDPEPDIESIEDVKRTLVTCGYEGWLKKQ